MKLQMDNKTNKFAVLISAYTEPKSLYSLVIKLNGMLDADFFIHIDKKVAIEPFQVGLKNMTNVFFVKERIKVYWGGYSQVLMQISLIREMFSTNIRYVRVVNITGTDYPIVSRETLYEKLNKTDVEYICGYDLRREIKAIRKRMNNKFARFYVMDTHRVIRAVIKRLNLPRLAYRKLTIPMYFGSEYWALTFECLTELVNEYIKNEPLQKLLRFSFVPSEAWIHTMFFNSRWKSKAIKQPEDCDDDLINLSPVTYFKYGDSIKVLDEGDYEDIIKSGRLFARKIIRGKSDGLISLLEQMAPSMTS